MIVIIDRWTWVEHPDLVPRRKGRKHKTRDIPRTTDHQNPHPVNLAVPNAAPASRKRAAAIHAHMAPGTGTEKDARTPLRHEHRRELVQSP